MKTYYKLNVNLKTRFILMNVIIYSLIASLVCALVIVITGLILKANATWLAVCGAFYIVTLILNAAIVVCMICILVNTKLMCKQIKFNHKRIIITTWISLVLIVALNILIESWNLNWSDKIYVLIIIGCALIAIWVYLLIHHIQLYKATKLVLNKNIKNK